MLVLEIGSVRVHGSGYEEQDRALKSRARKNKLGIATFVLRGDSGRSSDSDGNSDSDSDSDGDSFA